jgi:hypothetical protein
MQKHFSILTFCTNICSFVNNFLTMLAYPHESYLEKTCLRFNGYIEVTTMIGTNMWNKCVAQVKDYGVRKNFPLCEQLQSECTSIMWTNEIRMLALTKCLKAKKTSCFIWLVCSNCFYYNFMIWIVWFIWIGPLGFLLKDKNNKISLGFKVARHLFVV